MSFFVSEVSSLEMLQVFRHATIKGLFKPVPDLLPVCSLWESVPLFFQALRLRIHRHVPELLTQTLDAFWQVVNGDGAVPLMKKLLRRVKDVGLFRLIRDAWKGVRSL